MQVADACRLWLGRANFNCRLVCLPPEAQQLLAQIQPLLRDDEQLQHNAPPRQRAWHAEPFPFMRINLMQRPWWQRLAIAASLLLLFIALLPLLMLALVVLVIATLLLRHKISRVMGRPFRRFD